MSNCPDCKETTQAGATHVPNFAVTGFSQLHAQTNVVALGDHVQALQLSGCVSATYNPGNNQICFDIPIFGSHCVPSPISIPVGAQLSACFSTCGSIIPTGVRITINLNGNPIYTFTIGRC